MEILKIFLMTWAVCALRDYLKYLIKRRQRKRWEEWAKQFPVDGSMGRQITREEAVELLRENKSEQKNQ